ncbi:MAG: MATE family efflux transporter [Coprobacillaceae bacterium]
MNLTQDMTKGNPLRIIIKFGIPLLIGNMLQQVYNMVDSIIVGKGISVDALAAVGSTGSINFLVLGFVIGLTQGVTILVAQYFGAKDITRLRKSITMSAYLTISLGVLVTIFSCIFAKDLLVFMNTPNNILDNATKYIRIIFVGTLITFAFNFFSGILRAVGDSKSPLIAMIISFFVNVVLDVLFVISFDMGVAGAAYATVIAQVVSAGYCYYRVSNIEELKIKREDWKYDHSLFKKTFKLSLPVALMNAVTAVGVMVLQYFVNGYGSLYVAGYTAGSKIVILLEQISNTFGFAIATFVGQNLGANKIKRIKEGVNKTAVFIIVINIIVAILMFIFGKSILSLMIDKEEIEVIKVAYNYLVITSLFLWTLGLLFVYRCSLQSMGDTLIPMISGIIEFFARIIAIIVLPSIFGFNGVAFSEAAAWVGATILLAGACYYRIHKYQNTIEQV